MVKRTAKLMKEMKAGFIEILLLILPLIMPLLLKLLEWLKTNPAMTIRQRTKYQPCLDRMQACVEVSEINHNMSPNWDAVANLKGK